MKQDQSDEGIQTEGRRASQQRTTIRFRVGTCWALLGLSLLTGRGAGPARAAGLDIVWQQADSSTWPAVVALSPDGQIVASGTDRIQLRRITDGSLIRTLNAGEDVGSVTFSPDSQILASGLFDGQGRLWRVSDGQLLRAFAQEAIQFAFTPDNRMLAVMGKGDTVQLTTLLDDAPLRTFGAGPGSFFPFMALSPDGRFLATATADTKLWRLSDGQLLDTLPAYFRPDMVRFSPDSQLLVVGDKDKVFLWRVADGALLRTLSGHKYWVSSAAFSKDGKLLVTSSDDVFTAGKRRGEINFWSIESGELLRSYDPEAGITSLTFSPDGLQLVYGLEDGSVVVARNPFAPGQ